MRRREMLKVGAVVRALALPRIGRAQDARVLRFVPQTNLSLFGAVAGTQYVVRNAPFPVFWGVRKT